MVTLTIPPGGGGLIRILNDEKDAFEEGTGEGELALLEPFLECIGRPPCPVLTLPLLSVTAFLEGGERKSRAGGTDVMVVGGRTILPGEGFWAPPTVYMVPCSDDPAGGSRHPDEGVRPVAGERAAPVAGVTALEPRAAFTTMLLAEGIRGEWGFGSVAPDLSGETRGGRMLAVLSTCGT
mmetsp:Transcript_45032/g.88807  ORF Transcript_45032/g.88807 Transcript_45032/m.88807 type:complete len:180 (+) Transcript_45032:2-541(+)